MSKIKELVSEDVDMFDEVIILQKDGTSIGVKSYGTGATEWNS